MKLLIQQRSIYVKTNRSVATITSCIISIPVIRTEHTVNICVAMGPNLCKLQGKRRTRWKALAATSRLSRMERYQYLTAVD